MSMSVKKREVETRVDGGSQQQGMRQVLWELQRIS